jgi:hypothetical protein
LSGSPVSPELRQLLEQRLASVEQIEVVLLLMREPDRSWTAPEVAQALGAAPEAVAMRLFLLASSALILFEAAAVPRYRYASRDREQDRLLRELAQVYANDRRTIASIVETGPRDPIRSFADAFKLKN